jgi:predicted GTPase
MERKKVIIMGAAGRDFHNFNTYFRENKRYDVVCFTATQIPKIENRRYPPVLSGKLYPNGIPIYPEEKISELIKEYGVDEVVLAYSDLSYDYVMHHSAIVNAAGANFILMGPKHLMLKSKKPVIAVTAVRTGSGKSQTSRAIFKALKSRGYRIVCVRHPMPYGNLEDQVVQRFTSYEDFDRYHCTIEEREEYEPYVGLRGIVYAGVDYQRILHEAEEAEIILWDGGNNDFSFFKPDLYITVADPHRAGHELSYYPGEVNLRMANIVIINKVNTAKQSDIALVERNTKKVNPKAKIIKASSPISIGRPELIRGKRVLVVEDGPTLTHGGMSYGAATLAAINSGAKEIIDPRPYAIGSIVDTFKRYPHLTRVLPAIGYGEDQIKELETTINRCNADLVLIGTPINLAKLIHVNKPMVRIRYEMEKASLDKLMKVVEEFLKEILPKKERK